MKVVRIATIFMAVSVIMCIIGWCIWGIIPTEKTYNFLIYKWAQESVFVLGIAFYGIAALALLVYKIKEREEDGDEKDHEINELQEDLVDVLTLSVTALHKQENMEVTHVEIIKTITGEEEITPKYIREAYEDLKKRKRDN